MNFRAPVEYRRGEQARKGGRDSKAKFKDRKVWTVAVGRRSASARFQIRRSPGECTSIQIYRRRVHCTHAFPRLRDSGAFQRSERCIIIGASALSIRGNPENNPKKSGLHGFMTPFYKFTSAPLQPTLPFSSFLFSASFVARYPFAVRTTFDISLPIWQQSSEYARTETFYGPFYVYNCFV